ncbi:hypothetical protein B0A48_03541 [Cryoendolithus antarcticus]|uniref:Post-SET domain-containing protein n=1 Tax=Cryoendolithus antarcticus TaxID=1507870 RepID=A0A1V8TKI0_9PEZI|nr:hypothetical protein B0A48_03541 [Cryoendolithus antarcticus]
MPDSNPINDTQRPSDASPRISEPLFPITTSSLDKFIAYEYDAATDSHSLIATRHLEPNTHIAYITTHTPEPTPLYSTVQTSRTTHIELNSPLLYLNHSCNPTASIHIFSPDPQTGTYPSSLPVRFTPGLNAPATVKSGERGIAGQVRVGEREVKKGEGVTFFYPCTEWSMGRGFQCACGEEGCLGRIEGAKGLSRTQMAGKGQVADWIVDMMQERDGEAGRK